MPTTKVRTPWGEEVTVQHPEGASEADIIAYAKKNADPARSFDQGVRQRTMNQIGGILRGAGSIGATIMTPFDMAAGRTQSIGNPERRAGTDEGLRELGADPESGVFQGLKFGTEVAGTAGVGNALAALAGAAKASPAVVNALRSFGMTTGGRPATFGGSVADMAVRTGAGAATGGAAAGLLNPEDAKTGALIGGAMPIATKAAGEAGKAIGRAVSKVVPKASPEVVKLAERAKEFGIDIPADRLIDSRPINAAASSLNYVPFSGRAAVEDRMFRQFNRAVSRTIGEDSDNLALALRSASSRLSDEFDRVLKSNSVSVDKQLLDDATEVLNRAIDELGSNARPIEAQFRTLFDKGASGSIDGQAAYNIKRTLDRLGGTNDPNAFHARELKRVLMEALNRSLGPDEAAKFATVRRQYGNVMDLEGMVPMGAEGGISVGRLASTSSRSLKDKELRDLADIAGQFLKARESPHGAAQRVTLGGLGAGIGLGTGIWAPLAVGAGIGRGANAALSSDAARALVLNQPRPNALQALLNPDAEQMMYRVAPVLAGDR